MGRLELPTSWFQAKLSAADLHPDETFLFRRKHVSIVVSGSGPTPYLLSPKGIKAIETAIKRHVQLTTVWSWKAQCV